MKNKKLLRNIGMSMTAQVIALTVSFIMNLILPKFISEVQYAYWQTYLLYVGYVGILHLGILDGIVLRYSEYDYEQLNQKVIRSQFQVMILINTIAFLIIAILSYQLTTGAPRTIFFLVGIGIFTKNIFNYTSYLFQITNRIRQYAKMIIVYRLFYGIAVLILLGLGIKNFYYFCLVDLCSELFGVLVMIRHNRGLYFGCTPKFHEVVEETKRNIAVGSMLMGANWSAFLLTGSARMIVQFRWNRLFFGKISFSFSIANLFLAFVSAASIVLFPMLKRLEQSNLPSLYLSIRNKITPFLIGILLLYYPGCFILERWIPAYQVSLSYLGILLPMIIFTSKVSLLTNNFFKVLRKEKQLLLVNLISLGLGLLLFSLSAYLLDSARILVFGIIIVLIVQSILSEVYIMRCLKIHVVWSMFSDEILMTAIFILSTLIQEQMIGFLLYLVSVVIFFLVRYQGRVQIMKGRRANQ